MTVTNEIHVANKKYKVPTTEKKFEGAIKKPSLTDNYMHL